MNLDNIRALVQSELNDTEQAIQAALHSNIPLIQDLGQHLLGSGGKRIRPLIVILCARACGYEGNVSVTLAAIIELIHSATLLHDDVVDHSELRRGRKTANAIWGNAASVLVGDYLYTRAFQMMITVQNMRVLELLSNATNKIAAGEILQLLNCHNAETSEDRYMEVIRHKTGTLFEISAVLGPVLAGQASHVVEQMTRYGMHLGIAFQLIDDALDYQGNTEEIGKNKGDDLAEGKPTLPLIHALKHGTIAQQNKIKKAIEQGSIENLSDIMEVIESTGAIRYTYDLANQYRTSATESLADLPDSDYRQALYALADFAIERHY